MTSENRNTVHIPPENYKQGPHATTSLNTLSRTTLEQGPSSSYISNAKLSSRNYFSFRCEDDSNSCMQCPKASSETLCSHDNRRLHWSFLDTESDNENVSASVSDGEAAVGAELVLADAVMIGDGDDDHSFDGDFDEPYLDLILRLCKEGSDAGDANSVLSIGSPPPSSNQSLSKEAVDAEGLVLPQQASRFRVDGRSSLKTHPIEPAADLVQITDSIDTESHGGDCINTTCLNKEFPLEMSSDRDEIKKDEIYACNAVPSQRLPQQHQGAKQGAHAGTIGKEEVIIYELTENDYLTGRGAHASRQPCNQRIRQMIQRLAPSYSYHGSRARKSMIVEEVIADICSKGGRILERHLETYGWIECTAVECRLKVSQRFREEVARARRTDG